MVRAILTKPFVGDLGLLLLRVFTGALLIHHGYEKLANIENFADAFVRPLHLPFPILLSYVAAFSEVVGSWLLIAGLLTPLLLLLPAPSQWRSPRHHHGRLQHYLLSCGPYCGSGGHPRCGARLFFHR